MLSDTEHWNKKYIKARGSEPSRPDSVLERLGPHFLGRGWAMDLACGRGANTGFLADCGYQALGIDCSWEALNQARYFYPGRTTHWLAADFDQFFFPEHFFAAVVIVRFLERKLTAAIVNSLAPGGVLFHRTFNANHLKNTPTFNARFTLAQGELRDLYHDLDIVDTNDESSNVSPLSFILARRA